MEFAKCYFDITRQTLTVNRLKLVNLKRLCYREIFFEIFYLYQCCYLFYIRGNSCLELLSSFTIFLLDLNNYIIQNWIKWIKIMFQKLRMWNTTIKEYIFNNLLICISMPNNSFLLSTNPLLAYPPTVSRTVF